MVSNRIRVGFHRVGIALAVLPGLAAVAAVIAGAYLWVRPLVKPPVWQIEHKATGKLFIIAYGTDRKHIQQVFAPMDVPDEALSAIAAVDQERQHALEIITIGGALSVLAASVYATSWLLGWVLRGFLGEGTLTPE
jgi:hypothetical protein